MALATNFHKRTGKRSVNWYSCDIKTSEVPANERIGFDQHGPGFVLTVERRFVGPSEIVKTVTMDRDEALKLYEDLQAFLQRHI